MSRNYGINRKMHCAGRIILGRWFHGGKKTVYDHGQRFGCFCEWAETVHAVRKMELVTFELVVEYGRQLQAKVEGGHLSTSSAKNYVSSVNTVMGLATRGRWRSVMPGADCGIQPRSYIPTESKAMSKSRHEEVMAKVDGRLAAIMVLQREFGLRFEESCKLSPKQALKEMEKAGEIVVRYGTKGGKIRRVPCRPGAKAALEKALSFQDGQSMIPARLSYKQYRVACYRQALATGFSFHPERHYYAHVGYESRTGAPPPVVMGWGRRERIARLAEYLGVTKTEAQEIDRQARIEIAVELGHNREEITNAYLG